MINTHQITTYTIESHPNPTAVYDWIAGNWHDLGENDLQEFIESFKAVAKYLGRVPYYCVSIVPDRGEYMKLCGPELTKEEISGLEYGCKYSGNHYDDTIVQAIKEGSFESALSDLHKQGEYLYSDEALKEQCEANEYEFLANGEFYG